MKLSQFQSALTAVAVLVILSVAQGIQFGKTYIGEGTYYGESSNGNCALRDPVPSIYKGMIPIAINAAQYSGSCGACLIVQGNGKGSGSNPIKGKFRAFVADKCPECKLGDIDLAKSGDGRWQVSWKFVPCPGGGSISYKFEGSNSYYIKVQPRGTSTPPTKVVVHGIAATFTDDNFWIVQSTGGPFPDIVKIVVTTANGEVHRDSVRGKSGVVHGL
jgi:expansin